MRTPGEDVGQPPALPRVEVSGLGRFREFVATVSGAGTPA
jgi:hypothetical protein